MQVPTATIDYNNQYYIFSGSIDAIDWKLYSINLNNGNVVYNPSLPTFKDPNDNLINWKYSNSQQKLIALHWNNSLMKEFLVSINVGTGQFSIIDSLPNIKWIYGFATIDDVNNRYIVNGGPNLDTSLLYSINIISGKVISSPPYPRPDGNIIEYQYSNSLNKLLALHWDNTTSTEYLVEVNTLNGTFTVVKSIPGVAWIQAGYTLFDDYNNRYIFRGGDNYGNWFLYSIDAITGNIYCSPEFPKFEADDNLVMPQVNAKNGHMYALHWESNSTYKLKLGNTIIGLYPNPINEKAKINLSNLCKKVAIFTYNSLGQIVRKNYYENSCEIDFFKEKLSPGSYFIAVVCDQVLLGTVKAIIIEN